MQEKTAERIASVIRSRCVQRWDGRSALLRFSQARDRAFHC